MDSLLGSTQQADVALAPFPHLVLDGVYPNDEYAALARGFPPFEAFVEGGQHLHNNQAVRIPAGRVIAEPRFPEAWRSWFAYHTSAAFWADIVRVFGDAIRASHPGIETRAGRGLADWRVGRKGAGENCDIALDALFVVNTPVTRASSVRPPHVDDAHKVFAGLFYMRAQDDDSRGGDLELFAPRGGDGFVFGGHYVPSRQLGQRTRIPYAPNRFVAFVNSGVSVHGVSVREPTPHLRRYINLVAETPFTNFERPRLPPIERAWFWLRERRNKAPGVTLRG